MKLDTQIKSRTYPGSSAVLFAQTSASSFVQHDPGYFLVLFKWLDTSRRGLTFCLQQFCQDVFWRFPGACTTVFSEAVPLCGRYKWRSTFPYTRFAWESVWWRGVEGQWDEAQFPFWCAIIPGYRA